MHLSTALVLCTNLSCLCYNLFMCNFDHNHKLKFLKRLLKAQHRAPALHFNHKGVVKVTGKPMQLPIKVLIMSSV